MAADRYSCRAESARILDLLLARVDDATLPPAARARLADVEFPGARDEPYLFTPFKHTETAAALKAVEGCLAAALADLGSGEERPRRRRIVVDQERATAFLFQAYLARVGGLGKLDAGVRALLKDTDLLQAQSQPYRRMAANLYETARAGEYYHIHGSLEASTTLRMLGLETHRPDLTTHRDIVGVIEPAVRRFTADELEALNARHRQAGAKALRHDEFLRTPHGQASSQQAPWTLERLEEATAPCPLPGRGGPQPRRLLAGVRVLELCRIIAGPVMGRILAEHGADVLKVTSPRLSDVPFFQVDGNMGKRAADVDLKTPAGRAVFERLLADADVVLDGYRPGALERLGYGPAALAERAARRGRGIVYVSESCFGAVGEWAHRPGWQQIADCVTGVAWEQGRFMGLDEPVVPPFPISDYGTGCMGAAAALAGLYQRATRGGSWLGRVSLLQYDLLLWRAGLLPAAVQAQLRREAGGAFLALRHAHSVDAVSGAALARLRALHPRLAANDGLLERWRARGYRAEVAAVRPVVDVDGLELGFARASRPNGSDAPGWDLFDDAGEGDCLVGD